MNRTVRRRLPTVGLALVLAWLPLLVAEPVLAAEPPKAKPATAPANPADKPAATPARATVGAAQPAQLDVFVKPSGADYFALTLPAQTDLPKPAGHDFVILFDTSASQVGDARDRGLAALRTLVGQFAAPDRVNLMAIDLNPVAMSDSFVSPDSAELTAAIDKLVRRVPLGATDLPLGLEKAAATFSSESGNAKAIVYIGDGVSSSQLFVPAMFTRLTGQLVDQQIPVISYGVGPRVDGALLAALANYTGGNIVLDDVSFDAKEAGLFLASSVRGPIVWISSTEWPQSFAVAYPHKLPPMRSDRETIVIGKGQLPGKIELSAQGQCAGQPWQGRWTAEAGKSSDDFSYLPQLVAMAEKDDGATLPTLGAKGLKQLGSLLVSSAEELITLAQQALAGGNLDDADRLLDEALRRDPNDPSAAALKREIAKRRAEQKPAPPAKPEAKPRAPKNAGPKATAPKPGTKKTPPKKPAASDTP